MRLVKFSIWRSRECAVIGDSKQIRYNNYLEIWLFGYPFKILEWIEVTNIWKESNGDI